MKPIGPLMREHRLIEKMLVSMMSHIDNIEKNEKVNPLFEYASISEGLALIAYCRKYLDLQEKELLASLGSLD